MIEGALVHILSATPPHAFIGCGAVIEGGLVATCRHVWRDATKGAPDKAQPMAEFPRAEAEHRRQPLELADGCEDGASPPDLVLLRPTKLPSGTPALPLAMEESLETGEAACRARLRRPNGWFEVTVRGTLDGAVDPEGRRQFTGLPGRGFWFARGSSGSPVFKQGGQQLAAILSLAELGADDGDTHIQESFVIPGTLIRRHVMRLAAAPVAEAQHIDPAQLDDILRDIGAEGIPVHEIPARLRGFVAESRARGAQPVPPSNDGADIDAVIRASRDKVQALDAGGALQMIASKIAEEEAARRQRLTPLLRETLAIQRLTYDHAGAKKTLRQMLQLDPNDVWRWVELGDLEVMTGAVAAARDAFGKAREAGELCTRDDPGNAEWQRDLSVSHNRIGDVQVSQGDGAGALASYRAGMAIAERLAASDPGNAQWQRDFFVSHTKIGDVLRAQGDGAGALASYRAGMAIAERLAASDPGNAEWQRDLSVSHERIGDVQVSQGDGAGALASYRAGMAIRERLAASDPGNAEWQRDLSVSHNRIGDVQVSQGDGAGALASYRAGMAIAERLAASDPGNAQWQRDFFVSHTKIGDVLRAQGDGAGALASYRAGMAIRERLAASDPGNAEWQRDLSVSHTKIGDVQMSQGDGAGALASYRAGTAIAERLAASDPGNAQWQRDLIISCVKLAEADPDHASDLLGRALLTARALEASGRLATTDAWMPADLEQRLAVADARRPPGAIV